MMRLIEAFKDNGPVHRAIYYSAQARWLRRMIWRIGVTYWFRRRSNMSLRDAWKYAGHMAADADYFTDENCSPRDAVDTEMSYWDAE